MIEIEMPKDITKYEAKLAGIATPRQAVCVTIAAILGYMTRSFLKAFELSQDMETFFMMVVAAIPLAFAVYKPYGMKLEDFLGTAVVNFFLAPSKRKYISENTYRKEYDELLKDEKHVISIYNKINNIKPFRRRINDPKDRPRQKVNTLNPELTGYL